jgi:voltage-gated potassium channel
MVPLRTALWAVARAFGSTVVILAVYYLIPFGHEATWVTIVPLVIGLILLGGLAAYQVRVIVKSPFPALRAVEALGTSIPLFLVLFASTYYVMSRISPGSFKIPLTRTDALYFTVTVFATVGFGDIVAKTQEARLVVTGQMMADLIALGLGLRIITGAVARGQQRKHAGAPP